MHLEYRVERRQLLGLPPDGGQRRKHRILPLVERLVGRFAQPAYALGAGQYPALGFQLVILANLRSHPLDLSELERHEFEAAGPLALVHVARAQLCAQTVHRFPSLENLALEILTSHVSIEQPEVGLGIEERLMLVLAMQLDETGCLLPHGRDRREVAIEVGAAAPLAGDVPPHD